MSVTDCTSKNNNTCDTNTMSSNHACSESYKHACFFAHLSCGTLQFHVKFQNLRHRRVAQERNSTIGGVEENFAPRTDVPFAPQGPGDFGVQVLFRSRGGLGRHDCKKQKYIFGQGNNRVEVWCQRPLKSERQIVCAQTSRNLRKKMNHFSNDSRPKSIR